MGIGAAFAMGLVSGFTRNIEQEKQRRLADEQKVDLLEQQLFKSALEGDATNAGIEAASSLIKSSRTKLQDRKPIDLFGTQTDGIDLDFTSMKSAIDNVSKYGTSFGTGANVFGTSVDINDSPNVAKSYLFLNEAESLLNNESVLAKIAAGGQTVQDEFIAKIKGSYGIIMSNMATNKVRGEQLLIPKIGPNVGRIINGEAIIIDSFAELTGADGVFTTKTEDGIIPTPFAFADPAAKAIYINLAKAVLPQGANPARFGEHYYNNYLSLIPGMTPDKKLTYLDGVISLGVKIPNLSAVDPDTGVTTEEMAIKFYPIIQSIAGNKTVDQVLMLAPYMTPPLVEKVSIPGFETIISGDTAQQYVLKRTGNKYKSFGEIEERASAINLTYDQLLKIEEIRRNPEMDSVTAYNAIVKYAFGVVDIGKSAITDLFSSMKEGIEDPNRTANMKEGERYIDEKYLEKLQKRIDNSPYAEYEALNIALAFKLARAADPSGRLSNQDIEQQLRRLGDPMDSQAAALAKIGILIDEIGAERDKLQVLVTYGKGTDVISPDRARVIDAAFVMRDLQTKYQNSIANSGTSETYTRSEKPMSNRQTENGDSVYIALDENNIPINPPVYVDVNGNKLNTDQLVTIEPKPPADPETTPAAPEPKPSADTETTDIETAPVATPEDTSNAADKPPADSGKAPPSDDTAVPSIGTPYISGNNVDGFKFEGFEGLYIWNSTEKKFEKKKTN